jgi:hypothetical protein
MSTIHTRPEMSAKGGYADTVKVSYIHQTYLPFMQPSIVKNEC